jgi:hypothetical protein
MRVRILLYGLLILPVARGAQAQCSRDPNDTYNQGGSGTGGFALTNLALLSAPLNSYPAGFSDPQAASNANYANDLNFSQALMSVVQRQATTFPIGSSLGGFSYTFDPQLGLPVRRTQSFGPMFADRPQSGGLHKFSVELAAQRTNWRALGGVDLRSGLVNIRTYPASVTSSGDPEAEYATTRITFQMDRAVMGLNYGLTSRIDIGVLLTALQATVDGTEHYMRTDLTTGQVLVVDGRHECGTSAGGGRIAIRGKFEFLSRPALDLAVGVEVRLPSIVAADQLTAGAAQTKMMLIGSLPRGSFSPHFNVGATYMAGYTPGILAHTVQAPNIKNGSEIDYTVGADVAVSNSLTLNGDVIGRSLLRSYNFIQTVEPLAAQITIKPGTVNLLLGTLGGKILIGHALLLNMSVAFPLNSAGLKPGLTPVIGLERAF